MSRMPSEPSFTVHATLADFRAAIWLAFRSSWLSIRAAATIGVLFLILFGVFLASGVCKCGGIYPELLWFEMKRAALPAIGGPVLFGALCLALAQSTARKRYAQSGTLDCPATYRLSKDEFDVATQMSWEKVPWARLSYFVRDRRMLIMRRMGAMYLISVKQLERADLEQLLAYLHEAGVKEYKHFV